MSTAPNTAYSVKTSPKGGAFSSRYPAIAHIPWITGPTGSYHRASNSFLLEWGIGVWDRANKSSEGYDVEVKRVPTPRSTITYAECLVNLLEWADLRGLDLTKCSYSSHISGQYQQEMFDGIWSSTGQPLAPNTINLRVTVASEYLLWMHSKGMRAAYSVPSTERTISYSSQASAGFQIKKTIRVRANKVREKSRPLAMPADETIKKWLETTYERTGQTLGLAIETILHTAMRREEVASLPVNVIPEDPSAWSIVNPIAPPHSQQILISISAGVKGQKFGQTPQGLKIGPARDILVPLWLANKWNHHRRTVRLKSFAKWMQGHIGKNRIERAQEGAHLFLSEITGAKLTGPQLYHAWRKVPLGEDWDKKSLRWAPHDGRHWWACAVLYRELKLEFRIGTINNETAAKLLDRTALSVIELQIQPQLGHVDKKTTMMYLMWIRRMVGVPPSFSDDN